MDALLHGFQNLAHWQVMLALFAGAMIGIVIGAVPGLEPAGAMAILLPFSLHLMPLAGIVLLLGVYGGAWYGGAIPAILLRVPGTPVNVLTTYDGYPMARNGEAHRALSLAYSSSFIGGTLSVLSLILLAPYLARIAENFGSPEYTMIALVALVSVVLAHQKQAIAAVMSLGFGLFLGSVGFERVFSTQRFTFDQIWLSGGVPMVPVVIGLFAMSQAFVLLGTKDYENAGAVIEYKNRFSGLIEAFRYPRTILRSAGLGIGMGLLPGVGEFGAQFLAYSLAQRASKTPELFGKGAPEGLIASETSISACTSTVMVPLLALGIPTDPIMAMILSVFMIHNIIPGPKLFVEHPEFITGLYLCLLMLNVIVLVTLLFATTHIMKLAKINPRFIGMTVLVLSMVGAYTQNYRVSDALIALVFALIGKIMLKNDIPGFPLVIGLVLGPLFEKRLLQSLSLSNGDPLIFLERPISATLFAMAMLAITVFLYAKIKASKAVTQVAT